MSFRRCHLNSLLLIAIVIGSVHARVFFTGTNPVLSSFAFPQDIMLIPGGDKANFYVSWQGFPWWGDIDQPDNRPYNKYILNGWTTPESRYYASINEYTVRPGFSRQLSEKLKLQMNLSATSQFLSAEAYGHNPDDQEYSYREHHSIREGYLDTKLATYFHDHPVGFKLGLGGINTSRPELEHKINDQSSNRYMWGWDEDGERYQDYFAIGSLFKLDLQAASTFSRHKVGTRFRLYTGTLDNYTWDSNDADYNINPKKIHNYTFRLYGIYNWFKREKFRFNTTVLTRYTLVDSIGTSRDNPDFRGSTEKSQQFVFQVNPNVNIFPWKHKMAYIDAAILCNFQHMKYDFVRADGMYVSTGRPYQLEDNPSENFSYAWENFGEIALDIYATIPVFGMRDRMAAVGISMLLWRRYRWMNKYFGGYESGSRDFHADYIRKTFDQETWLNTVVNLIYRQGKFMYRIDIGQPLIYSLTPQTKIYDTENGTMRGLSHEKMWLAQSGFKVGFFISTDLDNIIRYQPFKRPEF